MLLTAELRLKYWPLVLLFQQQYIGLCADFLNTVRKNDIRFFKNFFRTLHYICVLFIEIVKSSFAVIRIVFSKKLEIQPQIVFFEVPLKSEFLRTILANSITLTPGTITVDVDENRFCVHALDYTLADGIENCVFVHLLMKMEEAYND